MNAEASEGEHVQAFKVALARLKKDPGIADFLIYKPGPLTVDQKLISRFADLYRRGMAEVAALLAKVSTTRS